MSNYPIIKQTPADDIVNVTCYGKRTSLPRAKAIEDYLFAMSCSWGAEHERYETIFFQLLAGRTDVSDQIDWRG